MTGKETRELNAIFNKSGSGSETVKLCIPISWIYHLGISKENRKFFVTMDYDTNTIFIQN